jgi:hypothetical protein
VQALSAAMPLPTVPPTPLCPNPQLHACMPPRLHATHRRTPAHPCLRLPFATSSRCQGRRALSTGRWSRTHLLAWLVGVGVATYYSMGRRGDGAHSRKWVQALRRWAGVGESSPLCRHYAGAGRRTTLGDRLRGDH